MYKVILVPAACGQFALDVGLIESNANTLASQGWQLVQVYQTTTAGCTGAKVSAVMIFKRA